VALVTKSGSNDFHGNVRWLYRPLVRTSSNDFLFNAHKRVAAHQTSEEYRWSFARGASEEKQTVLFFLDYELRREASGEQVSQPVPSAESTAGNP